MSSQPEAFVEPIHDVSYLGHVELGTPKIEESIHFFVDLLGMREVAREGQSVYLRAWGDFDRTTLKLTDAKEAGLRHIGWRAGSPQGLERRVTALEAAGHAGEWIDGDVGHGPAYRFTDPEGHPMELYWETELYEAPPEDKSKLRNQAGRFPARGAAVRRLDHLHVLCNDVGLNRRFMGEQLGFRLRENVVIDDGTEVSSWISVTPLVHDMAISLDGIKGAKARLHHVGFLVENREDVLRGADIFADHGVFIETGPSKHKISHQFFVYVYEPGGNRIELVTGGYLIFQPDWKPVTWTQAERLEGQAWGLALPPTFHKYGTPVIDWDENEVEDRDIPVVGGSGGF